MKMKNRHVPENPVMPIFFFRFEGWSLKKQYEAAVLKPSKCTKKLIVDWEVYTK